MQFFDLSHQFKLDDLLPSQFTLKALSEQHWQLAKIRVEHDCLKDQEQLEGQIILMSNQQVYIELDWQLQDTGSKINLVYPALATQQENKGIWVKGAQLIDHEQEAVSNSALKLWLDGTLSTMHAEIEQRIKAYLNIWDYVEYQD